LYLQANTHWTPWERLMPPILFKEGLWQNRSQQVSEG
jgi:hypothetical protein